MARVHYLSAPYYERVLTAAATLLVGVTCRFVQNCTLTN
jgi:hypothetical protein